VGFWPLLTPSCRVGRPARSSTWSSSAVVAGARPTWLPYERAKILRRRGTSLLTGTRTIVSLH